MQLIGVRQIPLDYIATSPYIEGKIQTANGDFHEIKSKEGFCNIVGQSSNFDFMEEIKFNIELYEK